MLPCANPDLIFIIAARWLTSSSTLSKSRVLLANLSSRTTISTSPGSSRRITFSSPAASARPAVPA
jgi:hypothetical protein